MRSSACPASLPLAFFSTPVNNPIESHLPICFGLLFRKALNSTDNPVIKTGLLKGIPTCARALCLTIEALIIRIGLWGPKTLF